MQHSPDRCRNTRFDLTAITRESLPMVFMLALELHDKELRRDAKLCVDLQELLGFA